MLRRGWPVVALTTALAIGLAALYIVVAPKRYESGAVLFVSLSGQRSAADLQQGRAFSGYAVATYADIIDSAVVLGQVTDDLSPQPDLDQLLEMVTAAARPDTTLIDVVGASPDPGLAADVANAAAEAAIEVIPRLENQSARTARVKVQLIQRAVEASKPVTPDVERTLAIGLIVGLCVGLGIAIAMQALDTRLRRGEDLRQLSDVPLLAVLPHLRRHQRQGIVVRDEPTGQASEAYRTLRTNLTHLENEGRRSLESEGRRSLMFAPVADDHDGAQIPANLAWSIAQAGRRVLLVDLDLRQSAVGLMFGNRSDLGLADALAGEVKLSDVICSTGHEKLSVILSGTTQHPSDLLSTPIMSSLLEWAEREYDYVILHAPPLLTYTDAAVVSRVTGWTLVTVSVGRTRAHDLVAALGTLTNVRVKPLGLVLAGARGSAQENKKLRDRSRFRSRTQSEWPSLAGDRYAGSSESW
jgi:polysaccharide biosynthesis transport protein